MKESREGEDWFPLFQRGDETAFARVFEAHYRSIVYFASTILQQDSYAEDIAIQCFAKAWDRRSSFESARHVENFLFLVARNACISWLRAGRSAQSADQEWGRQTVEGEGSDRPIDLERVRTRLIQQLYQHLESLPGGDILRMSFLEGKSAREIAQVLGVTESLVYVRKFRSLRLLRQRLGKEDFHLIIALFLLGTELWENSISTFLGK